MNDFWSVRIWQQLGRLTEAVNNLTQVVQQSLDTPLSVRILDKETTGKSEKTL